MKNPKDVSWPEWQKVAADLATGRRPPKAKISSTLAVGPLIEKEMEGEPQWKIKKHSSYFAMQARNKVNLK